MTRLFILILAIFFQISSAMAVLPGEQLSDPKLEKRARNLSQDLRCLVCQNQSLDESDAPLAHQLRVLLRERLKAGDSDDAAKNFIVARYGDFVLLKPPFNWQNVLLWSGPFLVIAIGTFLLLIYNNRMAQTDVPAAPWSQTDEENMNRLLARSELE